ncbi:MAG: hypothetical protein ACO1OB_01605 [Archangium sp.]
MTKLLACCLALVGSVAFAVTDTIEVQLPTQRVMSLLHDRARASVGCLPSFVSNGTRIYVDHVEFPGSPTIRRSATSKTIEVNERSSFSGKTLQVTVPVKAFLKKSTTLENRDAAQDTYDFTPTTSLVFELAMRAGSNSGKICADLVALEPAWSNELLESMQETLGTQCFPVKLDGFDDLLDGKVEISGRGISASSDLSTLALRLEFGNPNANINAWRSFNDGTLSALGRTGDNFAIGFDTELFARVIRQRFADNIDDPVTLTSGITSSWLYGQPWLQLRFDADVDVGACFNTIGVEPFAADMIFSLADDGQSVKLNGSTSTDLVDSDVLLCGLPYAGIGALLAPILFPVIEAAISGIAAGQSVSPDDLPSECHGTGDDSFSCAFPLVLPSLTAGGNSLLHLDLAATSLSRSGTNLVIAGTTTLRGPPTFEPRTFIESPVQLRYGIHGGCGNGLHTGSEAFFRATGNGVVCKPMVLTNDPAGAFGMQGLGDIQRAPWELSIAQFANPPAGYSATIVARTSGGARTVKLMTDAALTPGESEDLMHELVAVKANCMAKETGLFGIPGLFDPRWKVDPPYDLVSRVRSFDPSWMRATVRTRLDKVQFETLGRTTRPIGRIYSLTQQDVRVTAVATVDFGTRGGKKTVNVSTVVRANFSGKEIGSTGIVSGSFPAGTKATFQVNSSSFPAGVSGIDVDLDLSPGALALQGTLNAQ